MSRFFYTDYIRFLVLFLYGKWFWTIERRNNGDDAALLIEGQLVDAHLAMDARILMEVMLVNAMIDNVPLVLARNLQHGVMSCAVDAVLGLLLDDEVVLLVNGDRTEG